MEQYFNASNADNWSAYLSNKTQVLMQLSDYQLDEIIDSEVFNPSFNAIMLNKKMVDIPMEYEEEGELTILARSAMDSQAILAWPSLRGIKAKTRKIFCEVVRGIDVKDFNLKEVIKTVLLALSASFFGGIPAVILSLLIAIIVRLLKMGLDKACPA
jgi:hypothetical protein